VSHSEWHKGVVPYPAWMVLELFNHHGTGDLLYVEAQSVPTIDLPKKARRPATPDAPLAGCYATRKGDRLSLFVVSRKIDGYPVKGDDGYTPVTVDLPFDKASKITLYRMAADPRAHNLDSKQVEIEKIDIPASRFHSSFKLDEKVGADARGLPPAATMLYVFEGIDMPAGKLVAPQGLDE
jgi:hypothetical protein